MEECKKGKKHFVLVHGACHGAWCWNKVATLLTSADHQVSAVDLACSGINPTKVEDARTLAKYSEPLLELMASLPPLEKVILVGHSYGGLNLALAMDKFPHQVSVAIFATAFMPDSSSPRSYVLEKFSERTASASASASDNQYTYDEGTANPTSLLFGPKCLAQNLYQLSPLEDLTLAKTLVRPVPGFMEDLQNSPPFSVERYGSVTRAFIVSDEDLIIPKDFQYWMIDNYPVKEVKEIKGSDHMPMFSKPHELCHYLLDIAAKYA